MTMAARTWFVEVSGEDKLVYLVKLDDQQAKLLSDELMGLVQRDRIETFKMDPADEVSISLSEIRRRLGLGRS